MQKQAATAWIECRKKSTAIKYNLHQPVLRKHATEDVIPGPQWPQTGEGKYCQECSGMM